MFSFFTELFLIQILLLLIIFLLFINNVAYSLIFLSMCFTFNLIFILNYSGLTIFAFLLATAEIHIYYLITCLLFSWVRFDVIKLKNLTSSIVLLKSRFLLLLVVFFIIIVFFLQSYNIFIFNIDVYVYNILLVQTTNYLNSGALLNILNTLSLIYLTINSLEFFILNILMLLTTIIYYFIVRVNYNNNVILNVFSTTKILRLLNLKTSYIRSASQAQQLTRCAAVHLNSNKSSQSVFLKK